MATIQDVFSHIYTTETNLSSVAVKHGQIILCVDSEKLYIDHGSTRVGISDVVQVETQDALPLAPLDKFYITKDTGDVYFYINDVWKKLTDTITDYTAFKVYAHDTVIPAGEHNSVLDGIVAVEIPAGMTHEFIIRSQQNKDLQDVMVNWGDGTITSLKDDDVPWKNAGDRRYTLTHTYSAVGTYTVKVYGTTFFGIWHSSKDNLLYEALVSYLPVSSHHHNLGGFLQGSQHLTWLSCPLYIWHGKSSVVNTCAGCRNLLSAYGFSALGPMNACWGIFNGCINLAETDFVFPSHVDAYDGYKLAFCNCAKLERSLKDFFPAKGFSAKKLDFSQTFYNATLVTWDDSVAQQLWKDPTIEWVNVSQVFEGCSDDVRSHVPTSWGGTSTEEIVGNLPVAKLSLNGYAPNTANGLVILNAQGKVDGALLPDTSIDLSNYSQNSSIKLTSTAGAVDLISNTMEVALYSGTAHVKANVDSVELQGTNLKFNNNAQNTAGGIVVVDTDTGKVPSSVLPEMGIDLTNYVTEENISLNAAGVASNATYKASSVMRIEGGTYTNIDTTAGPLNLGTSTSDVFLGGVGSNRNVTIQVTSISNLKLATGTNMDGSSANTANGFAIVGADGKLPASIVPETTGSVDLSAYNGLVGITTTGVSSISNGASGEYKFTLGINSNGVILTEDRSTRTVTVRSMKKISLEGGEISIIGYPFKIHSNGKLELSSSQGNIILNAQDSVDANIEIHGTGILWNGAALNTAEGLVQLGADGKVPSSMLPEMTQSWAKVTINQSSFATSDGTYGGSYYELDGICSVEVYDANGYKVEFDVKCDFTNNKTRVYIPSGLAADTISNWTLLYLAKTIA